MSEMRDMLLRLRAVRPTHVGTWHNLVGSLLAAIVERLEPAEAPCAPCGCVGDFDAHGNIITAPADDWLWSCETEWGCAASLFGDEQARNQWAFKWSGRLISAAREHELRDKVAIAEDAKWRDRAGVQDTCAPDDWLAECEAHFSRVDGRGATDMNEWAKRYAPRLIAAAKEAETLRAELKGNREAFEIVVNGRNRTIK